MGSAGFDEYASIAKTEHNSDDEDINGVNSSDVLLQRPEFVPCGACGRKFTLRALEIHKRSCTEQSDCSCTVCKTSPSSLIEHATPVSDRVVLSDKGNTDSQTTKATGVRCLYNGKLFYIINKSPGAANFQIKSVVVPKSIQEVSTYDKTAQMKESLKPAVMTHLDHSYSNTDGNVDIGGIVDSKNVLSYFSVNPNSSVNGSYSSQASIQDASKIYVVCPDTLGDAESPENSIKKENVCDPVETQKRNLVELEEALEKQKVLNAVSPDHSLMCNICNKDIFWDSFGSHIIHHSQLVDKHLLCPRCPQKFSNPGKLLIHFHKHMAEFAFSCRHCGASFQNCVKLKQHSLDVHGYVELHPFHCYICWRRFSHSQTIINHMRLHSRETPFKCDMCSRSFNQIGNLHRHISVHRGERPHKCLDCDKAFADPATLRNHVRIHTGETPYVCKICRRAFTQIGNLKRHMARHLQGRSRTTAPDSYGAKIVNMDSDNSNSAKDNNTVCQSDTADKSGGNLDDMSCSASTSGSLSDENSVSSFVSIINSAHEPEIILNDVENVSKCTKKSKRKQNLFSRETQEEAKRVCDEKNWELFPCPVCAKVYTWQHDLNIHFRIHSGEKPYSCDMCDKKFAQSGAVRTHKLRHH